ncbi:MAG: glycerophosphodiester phosphodiesterase family protein [Terriglobia bacterium]|jgi:glycerophosphoryl diester phosphodiesterase
MSKSYPSLVNRSLALVFATAMVYAGCLLKANPHAADQPRIILTTAHRGEHLHHPENSIPAIEAAIDAGMDFVELGIRTTADGKLVLMHDRTVDRMTDGKGLVKDKTLAKIKALDLGVRFPGQFPNLRVPTFDEALAAAHGRIGIYIDAKDATPQDLIAAIERHDMGSHVLFWSEHPDFMSQIQQLRPDRGRQERKGWDFRRPADSRRMARCHRSRCDRDTDEPPLRTYLWFAKTPSA